MEAITQDPTKMTAAQLRELANQMEAQAKAAEQKEQRKLEQDRTDFLKATISKFLSVQNELKALKEFTIKEGNNLDARMWEINDRERPERNKFTIKDENDRYKVTIDQQERFEFTEEATVHITEIKEIFHNKFSERNKGLYNILEGLLIKGSKQEYDPKMLAKARRQVRELGDERLIQLFDNLDECQRVVGTSLYCRAYRRGENNKWEDISLQFSSL